MQEDYTPPGVKLRFACSMRKEKVIQKIYYRKWWFTMKERKKTPWTNTSKLHVQPKNHDIYKRNIYLPNSKPPFLVGFQKSWVFPGKKKHILGEGYRVLKLMCFLLQNSIYNNWLSPPRHTDWSSPRSPTTAVPAEIPGKQNARKKQFRKRLGYFSRP